MFACFVVVVCVFSFTKNEFIYYVLLGEKTFQFSQSGTRQPGRLEL